MSAHVFFLRPLSPALDAQFHAFSVGALEGQPLDTRQFDDAAWDHFDRHHAHAPAIDAYFYNFTPLWREWMRRGAYRIASDVWAWSLRPVTAWESAKGTRLHKGTSFYFAAVTALVAGDLDAGYLLAHRALQEDCETQAHPAPETPALALVRMEPDTRDDIFGPWMNARVSLVEAAIDRYREMRNGSLTLSDLRTHLLWPRDVRAAASLFGHAVARLHRFAELPCASLQSEFADQLRVNLIVDLTLVTSAVVRAADPNGESRFVALAEAISADYGLGLDSKRLKEIVKGFKHDFDQLAVECLAGTLTLQDGFRVQGLAADLAFVCGCRTRGAQDAKSSAVVRSRFAEVSQATLNVLFAAIERLR